MYQEFLFFTRKTYAMKEKLIKLLPNNLIKVC